MAGNGNASAEGDQMKRETRAQRPPAILGAQAWGRRGVVDTRSLTLPAQDVVPCDSAPLWTIPREPSRTSLGGK